MNGQIGLGSAIAELGASLKEALISCENFGLLKKFADIFPSAISPFWCLELPLSKNEKIADLLFCVTDAGYLREYFLYSCPHSLNNKALPSSFSPGIREFADEWAGGKSLPFQKIVNIWFEYDHQRISEGFMTPNFFYAPAKRMHPFATVLTSQKIFEIISVKPVPATTYKLLLECMHQLPGNSWISQIGMMVARNENNLRLFIQQIPTNGIAGYLEKINYPYIADQAFIELLLNCYKLADQVDLDIDISETIGETIGLECSFDSMQKALYFLEYLLCSELCHPEKHKSLHAYLKKIRFDPNSAYQPFLSHFKIVFHPLKPLIAKVYIGYAENTAAPRIIRTNPLNC